MDNQALLAAQYAKTSDWQYVRGMLLLDQAELQGAQNRGQTTIVSKINRI